MDKILDLKKLLEKNKVNGEDKKLHSSNDAKTTNPILKKLAAFTNDKLSNKFNINDLLR